jgi:hypothetical protein
MDDILAVEWFRKGAEAGSVAGMYDLGLEYSAGGLSVSGFIPGRGAGMKQFVFPFTDSKGTGGWSGRYPDQQLS